MSSEMVARAIGQQPVAQFAQQLVAQMPSKRLTERVLGGMSYEC